MTTAAASADPATDGLSEPVLTATSITKRFGGLVALDDVSIQARPGEITALVGPNGAGKTTLFAVLSGIQPPDGGSVHLAGEDITRRTPQQRAHRGLARTYQRLEIFHELTVREHLVLAYRSRFTRSRVWTDLIGLSGRRDAAEQELVDRLLVRLGLTELADAVAGSLPVGTARKVEMGRALAARPRVVLLDEPSSGLDTAETAEFAEMLVSACRDDGVACLLVEHDLDLVLSVSARVFVLDFGRMIASGSPDQVRTDPLVQKAYLGRADNAEVAQ